MDIYISIYGDNLKAENEYQLRKHHNFIFLKDF